VTPVERAEAHIGLARVYRTLSDWDAAIREASSAARLADEAANGDLAAEAMNVEVGVHQLRGDFVAGERLAQHALSKAHSPRVRGILLQNLGAIAAQRREFSVAERYFSQSVEAFTAARYEIGIAIALNNASAAARDSGDFERSLELAIVATNVADRIDALDTTMLALQNQAHALLELGHVAKAESILSQTLGHYAATHNALRYAECLEIMGRIHEWTPGYIDSAVQCYQLAAATAEKVNDRVLVARLESRLARMGRSANVA